MKRRYCCQLAVVLILILFLVYHIVGAQSFSALQISELESQVLEGERITIEGTIDKKFRKEEGFDFLLKPYTKKEFVYVSMSDNNQFDHFKIGQTVKVTGEVTLFDKSPNPGNFNQKFYYQKQNIYVKLWKSSAEMLCSKVSFLAQCKEFLWEIQQCWNDKIVFYAGERYGGILSAMVLGEDIFVDDDLKELLQKSGIGHLLAISGLHVSFIGSGLYKFMRKIGIPIVLAAVLGGSILTVYVFMIGTSTSALRAWVMFLLQMGAHITGREYDGKTALAVATFVVLAGEPVFLFDAGFLLSFGAVLGIYGVAPALKMKVPLAIQCVLFPVQLYYYYEICIYSLLWNTVAIPLSTIALGSGLLGVMMCQLPFVPELVVKYVFCIGKIVIWSYEVGSSIVLKLPFSRIVFGQPPFLWMVIYYFVLGVCAAFLKKKWMLIAAGLLLLAGTLHPSDKLEITMLNVGQGDCFFIKSPDGGTYMIDGGSSSVSQVGQYRIEPYFKQQGIGTLDYVWVTHGDVDHVNGIIELLERRTVGLRVKNLILSPEIYWNENITGLISLAENVGTKVHIMRKGQSLEDGKMIIKCLWPEENDDKLDVNQASIVLSLTYGAFDMLFTGDLEKEAEEEVSAYIENEQKKHVLSNQYEVLKVGHHGSKYSTSEFLLEVVKPKIALVSVGERNLYGHPHSETLERLENIGSDIWMTKEDGAVKIETDGDEILLNAIVETVFQEYMGSQ